MPIAQQSLLTQSQFVGIIPAWGYGGLEDNADMRVILPVTYKILVELLALSMLGADFHSAAHNVFAFIASEILAVISPYTRTTRRFHLIVHLLREQFP